MVSYNEEYNITGMPPQKLPSSKKNKDWGIKCVNGIIGMSSDTGKYGRPTKYEMQDNYDIINSIFDAKKMSYLTNPSNISDKDKMDLGGMPTVLRMHNIIRPKLELLAGEEGKKLFKWTVVGEDGAVINDKIAAKQQSILEALQALLLATTPEEEPSLEDINKKHKVVGVDIRERNCQRLLEKIWRDQNLKQKFSKGFKHATISAHEIYYVSKHKGKPHCRVVNPMNFEFDKNPDLDFIEDGDWAREEREMTISSIIDTYGEYLTEEEIEKLDKGQITDMSAYDRSTYLPQITEMPLYDNQANQLGSEWVNFGRPGSSDGLGIGYTSNYTNRKLRVHTVVWRSYRKIGFLTDPEGYQTIIEDDTFKLSSNQRIAGYKLEWEYIIDIWKGTRIGGELFVDIRPLENQTGKLPYVGYIYNNLNSKAQSLVDIVKEHQYTYMEIWYKLMMEVAKAKGKKIILDSAQIPSDMSPERWLYWYDIVGIVWINSFEEEVEGDPQSRSKFNQQQVMDQSLASSVNNYIMMLDKVERMIGDVLGVSPEREGATQQTDTASGIERSVTQSSLITEPFFIQHNEVKKNVLSQLLDVALLCVLDESSPMQLLVDDSFVELLLLDGEQLNDSKYKVEISDAIEDTSLIEKLKGLAQAAIQNGAASLSSIGMLYRNNSVSDILGKLREWEEQKAAQEQALEEQRSQIEQARIAAEQARYDSELEYKKEKDQLDRENKLQIAQISALRGKDGPSDVDGDGIPDPIEVGKLYLEQSKLSAQQAEATHKQGLEVAKEERENAKFQLELQEKQLKLKQEQDKLFLQAQQQEIDRQKIATELQLQANETNQQNQHKLMDIKEKEKDRQLKLKELAKKEKMERLKIKSNKNKSKPTKKK